MVAAYNAQVDCVREALIAAGLADSSGTGVRVGTVDKFQGQEAAVVLVSLASSRVDSGRGAGFVLSPNRLNVAVAGVFGVPGIGFSRVHSGFGWVEAPRMSYSQPNPNVNTQNERKFFNMSSCI